MKCFGKDISLWLGEHGLNTMHVLRTGDICGANLALSLLWLIRKVRLVAVLDKPSTLMV